MAVVSLVVSRVYSELNWVAEAVIPVSFTLIQLLFVFSPQGDSWASNPAQPVPNWYLSPQKLQVSNIFIYLS